MPRLDELLAVWKARAAALERYAPESARAFTDASDELQRALRESDREPLTLAQAVICGGLLAGCAEAPGEVMEIGGKLYKQYRGIGSLAAMKSGSAARYGQDKADTTRKLAAEGIEALKEVAGSADRVLAQLIGGIQSGMGYLGASNLAQLCEKARYIRVSPAGQREAAPHDVVELKTGH